jgi:predicted N-acetyltransferase YhbS
MAALLIQDRAPGLRVVPSLRLTSVDIRDERVADVAARERLLDVAFGPARFTKTCQRLRDGRTHAHRLAFIAKDGKHLVGTLRFWNIEAGDRPALLLGPIAVAESHRCAGIGSRLIRTGLDRAQRFGHRAVLLVGDAPYYARFGFERRFAEPLIMPGPVEDERFLGLELVPGALAGVQGLVVATGARVPETAAHLRQAA